MTKKRPARRVNFEIHHVFVGGCIDVSTYAKGERSVHETNINNTRQQSIYILALACSSNRLLPFSFGALPCLTYT